MEINSNWGDLQGEYRASQRCWDGPRCVPNLIWSFLWPDWPQTAHPLDDLNYVCELQAVIPPCFLRDRLPTLDSAYSEVGPHGLGMARLYQLFPPSPFRRGNPYLPMACLDPSAAPWSMLPTELLKRITKVGYQDLHTYRAHAERRLCQHYNRPVTKWNTSFLELFCAISGLDFEKHFQPGSFSTAWAPFFEQIAEARYVTVETP